MLPPSTFAEMTVDAANEVMVVISWRELRKVSFDNEVKGGRAITRPRDVASRQPLHQPSAAVEG